MDNNVFYVYDTHDCVWTSNPEFKNLTKWFVWDPHTWWEYAYALSQGVEFFPNAEIYRGVRPPGPGEIDFGNDKRKKVAILFYEHVRRHLASGQVSDSGPIEDYPNEIVNTALNWADIVITYSTEPLQNCGLAFMGISTMQCTMTRSNVCLPATCLTLIRRQIVFTQIN